MHAEAEGRAVLLAVERDAEGRGRALGRARVRVRDRVTARVRDRVTARVRVRIRGPELGSG